MVRGVGDLVRDGTTVTLSLVSGDLVRLLSNALKAVTLSLVSGDRKSVV